MKIKLLCCLPVIAFLAACHQKTAPKASRIPGQSFFVTVEPSVRLEVIDWGGSGEPLLFLAGLGNTAHVFDDFAPQFTDQYHVLGLTRRGFGASSQPDHGYDLNTLSKDILTVMDSLELERVTLIGHSIAGEELTKFASLYPGRVNKLIYLDAAFDRTDLSHSEKAPPSPWVMTAKDSLSLNALQQYLKRTYKVVPGISELKATYIFDKNGRLVDYITPDSIYEAMIQVFEHPEYEKVLAPALAFYCINDSVRDLFDYFDQLDATQQQDALEVFQLEQLFVEQQMELFRSKMIYGQVLTFHGANHHLFLSHPQEVEREIRKFLTHK